MQSRRTLTDHERRVVAFHEAGHALCAELLPGVNKVHKISIVPRGKALGYTLNLPGGGPLPQDARGADQPHGRAARRPRGGGDASSARSPPARPTTSSASPTSRASMVHEYAMGTSLTSLQVNAEGGAVSDRTRQLRDEEQQHLADQAMRDGDADRPRAPRQARRARVRAAAQRGARARRDRPHHGRRRAPGRAGRRRDLRVVAAETTRPKPGR